MSGPHHVYIFRDTTKPRFKIGITSYNLEYYRRQLCYKEYGRRSQDKIRFVNAWPAGDFFAAFFLEQTIVETLKRLEIERLAGDWFETDFETISGVWNVVDDLVYEIRKWEKNNYTWEKRNYKLWCSALQHETPHGIKYDTPYGEKVKSLPHGYFGRGLPVHLKPE